tara:strand:- start:5556 stop:6479 length:924 start_codon:yes stop_codon:yes gene_type:complete
MLLSYKQENFVADAVASALAQLGPPIEIIISDDASPDGTWAEICALTEAYGGPHTIKTHRNVQNMGLIAHFNQTLERSSGDIICYLAGDDIAVPNRVQVAVDLLRDNPSTTFVESASLCFGSRTPPLSKRVSVSPEKVAVFDLESFAAGHAPDLSSATRTFRKAPLMAFPPLDPALSSEDSPNALRLLLHGQGMRLKEALLHKRVHDDNITGTSGLMRIDFDQIRAQYVKDITHAYEAGILEAKQAAFLQGWAFRNIERRKLRRIIDLRHPGLFELARLILPSRHLGVRGKIYAIRRFLACPSLDGR